MTTVPSEGGTYTLNFPTDRGKEWFYTPTETRTVVFRTSGTDPMDTYIDMYTYPAYGWVGDDDDSGPDLHAHLSVTLTAGVDYVFYTQEYTRATGVSTLHVEPGAIIPPPAYTASNDNWSGAMPLPADSNTVPYDNTGATTETGEFTPNNMSTWYTWVAGLEDGMEFVYTPASADPKDQIEMRVRTATASNPNPAGPGDLMSQPIWVDNANPHRIHVTTVPGKRYWLQTSAPNGSYGSWGFGTITWQTMVWSDWIDSGPVNRFPTWVDPRRQSGGEWRYEEGGLRFIANDGSTYYGPPTDNSRFAPALSTQFSGVSWGTSGGPSDPPSTNPADVGAGNFRVAGNSGALSMGVTVQWSASFGGGAIYSDDRPVPWTMGTTTSQAVGIWNVRPAVLQGRAAPPVTSAQVGAYYEADRSYADPTSISVLIQGVGANGYSADSWDWELRHLPKERRASEDITLAEPWPIEHRVDVGLARGQYGTGIRYVKTGAFTNYSNQLVGNIAWIPREQQDSLPLLYSAPSSVVNTTANNTLLHTATLPASAIDSQGWIALAALHSHGRTATYSTTSDTTQYSDPRYTKGRYNWGSLKVTVRVTVPTRYRKLIPGSVATEDGYWPSHPQMQDPQWKVPGYPIALDPATTPKATKTFLPQYPVDDVYSTKFPTNNGAVVPARIV